MQSFIIKSSRLLAVALFASNEETRFYLNGVFVEAKPGAPIRLTATDGHRLLTLKQEWAEDAEQFEASFIIPSALIKGLKSGSLATVSIDGKAVTIEAGGLKRTADAVDGTFPDYRRVLPKDEPSGEVAQFNAAYVGDLGKASALLNESRSKSAYVAIGHNGNAPAPVSFGEDVDYAAAVLMPFRAQSKVQTPGWAVQ